MSAHKCIEHHPNDIDAVIAMAGAAGPHARPDILSAGFEPTIDPAGRVLGRK